MVEKSMDNDSVSGDLWVGLVWYDMIPFNVVDYSSLKI